MEKVDEYIFLMLWLLIFPAFEVKLHTQMYVG